jgi:ATP-binding cassette, subfamily B, bacterial
VTMMHNVWRSFRLGAYRGRPFYLGSAGWVLYFITPLGPGYLARAALNELQAGPNGRLSPTFVLLCVSLVVAEIAIGLMIWVSHRAYTKGFRAAIGLVQVNVLHAQLASGGADSGPPTQSPSEATSRFRDDPHDLIMFVDTIVDSLGLIIFATVAFVVLARIDPLATAVASLPLVGIAFGNRWIGHRARTTRHAARRSTAEVAGFLGSALSASTTVKVAGARDHVLARFSALSQRRAAANVTDQVLADSLFTIGDTVADVCVGLALIVAATRARSGALSAGDFALFASYFTTLVWLPRRIVGVVIGHKRFEVSARRLEDLLPPVTATVDPLMVHRITPIAGGGPVEVRNPRQRIPLVRLDLRDVTLNNRGVVGVNLTVRQGQLAILAGPVASGKTSLLHAVLGLLPLDDGEILWNDEPVEDRAAFFTPPQCAYIPQTPVLFADSLVENLLLGADIDRPQVREAVHLAGFDRDVTGFGEGLHTLIGARGVRLSGGQLQRAAAARAFVRRTELLIIDDLTSALDVETEVLLWDRLRAAGVTVLAASNRPAALERADVVFTCGSGVIPPLLAPTK